MINIQLVVVACLDDVDLCLLYPWLQLLIAWYLL